MLPVANAIAVKRRRVQGKRPPPEWYAALEVERVGEAGLAMLCQYARRFPVQEWLKHLRAVIVPLLVTTQIGLKPNMD